MGIQAFNGSAAFDCNISPIYLPHNATRCFVSRDEHNSDLSALHCSAFIGVVRYAISCHFGFDLTACAFLSHGFLDIIDADPGLRAPPSTSCRRMPRTFPSFQGERPPLPKVDWLANFLLGVLLNFKTFETNGKFPLSCCCWVNVDRRAASGRGRRGS